MCKCYMTLYCCRELLQQGEGGQQTSPGHPQVRGHNEQEHQGGGVPVQERGWQSVPALQGAPPGGGGPGPALMVLQGTHEEIQGRELTPCFTLVVLQGTHEEIQGREQTRCS